MYEKPVRVLMRDMVEELIGQKDQIISKEQVLNWFAEKYPKIKQGTISAHLIRFSTNAPSRLHYSARPGEEDLLFQIDGSHFRRFDPAKDPPPIHEAFRLVEKGVGLRNAAAIISVSWGNDVDVPIKPTPRNWKKVQSGNPLQLRGKGYYYDGEFFRDYWSFGAA